MIQVEHFTKFYGPKKAVDDISFRVEEGEILGFLGPNGAGKSTTMNAITGYLSTTEGKILIGGVDILEDPIQAKKQIGYLPEQPPLYLDMTVEEYLLFVCELKGIPRKSRQEEVDLRIEQMELESVRHRVIKSTSKGFRQRIGLAQALLGDPPVLILDEPTVGLDPKQILEIRELIRSLGKEHTIILSSHILSEVQAICDRILVISAGRVVADGTPRELEKEMEGDSELILEIEGPKDQVRRQLSAIKHVLSVDLSPGEDGRTRYMVYCDKEHDCRREIFEMLCEHHWPLFEMSRNTLSLEEIFLELTEDNSIGEEEMSDESDLEERV